MLGSDELVTGVRSIFGAASQAVTPQSVTHAKIKQYPRIVDPSPRQSWYNRRGRSSKCRLIARYFFPTVDGSTILQRLPAGLLVKRSYSRQNKCSKKQSSVDRYLRIVTKYC